MNSNRNPQLFVLFVICIGGLIIVFQKTILLILKGIFKALKALLGWIFRGFKRRPKPETATVAGVAVVEL